MSQLIFTELKITGLPYSGNLKHPLTWKASIKRFGPIWLLNQVSHFISFKSKNQILETLSKVKLLAYYSQDASKYLDLNNRQQEASAQRRRPHTPQTLHAQP